MSDCIKVIKLSKKYHKAEVVRSIDFDVKQGQIFAFLGPNGAGKSTTMNMLCTLLEKSDGKIYIDGLDLDRRKKEVKQKMGIVFQDDVLDRELSVYQNLLYRGGLYIKNKAELRSRINKVAEQLAMEDLLEKKYGDCSGGQRRIAQIGRALLTRPQLLILDEPTTGLDPIARRHVWDVLLRLRVESGMTIFYATHYMEEAAFADSVCVLDQGSVLLCDSMQHVRGGAMPQKPPALEQLYFRLLEKGVRG